MRKGRKKGSGFKSQLLILATLADRRRSSDEIQRLTEVNRNTVWYNLKILKGIKAVNAIRKGRNVFYQLNEHPQLKLLVFHAFMGDKWAIKVLKNLNRAIKLLTKSIGPIKEMYDKVRRYRADYEKLKNELPDLSEKDIWNTIFIIQQIKYVKVAKKYVNKFYIVKEPPSREKILEKRYRFIDFCKMFEIMLKDWANTILLLIYHEFLIRCFPEVLDYAEKYGNKGYSIQFELAVKLDDLISRLIHDRKNCIKQFSRKLKREIDDVSEFAIRFLKA